MGAGANRDVPQTPQLVNNNAELEQLFRTNQLFPVQYVEGPQSRTSSMIRMEPQPGLRNFKQRYMDFFRLPQICDWTFANEIEFVFLKCYIYERIMQIVQGSDPGSFGATVFVEQQILLNSLLTMITTHKNILNTSIDQFEALIRSITYDNSQILQNLYCREAPLMNTQSINQMNLLQISKYIYGLYQNNTISINQQQEHLCVICLILHILYPIERAFIVKLSEYSLDELNNKIQEVFELLERQIQAPE